MLLPAVGAVSAVSVSIEKPVVVTAETSGLQAAATPAAVLSSAVNASVEGKLNMLLVAARERMFDSLLSAIDTAARALNLSREPGESNAVYAQRVAAAISNLSPQQLAAAQQRMDAQMSTPVPLPLLAAALTDPESPQAVHLALSLEQASTVEPDAALKAVVNSYGQNAGDVKAATAQAIAPAILQKVADIAAQAASLASSVKEQAPAATSVQSAAQPASTPQGAAQPGGASSPTAAANQAAPVQALPQNGAATTSQAAPAGSGVNAATTSPSQPLSPPGNQAAGPLLAAIAAEAKLPTEIELIRSPLAPPPLPRDIQQIQADLKQGLQVVIGSPAATISSDLLQIINNPMASAEKIIAQALTAGAAGQIPQPAVDESGRSRSLPLAGIPVSLAIEEEMPLPAAALSGKPQLQAPSMAAMAMYDAAEQTGMPVPLPIGVPFVVANYLPTAAPAKAIDQKRIDRVDPVGDEEDQGSSDDEEMAQHQEEDDSRPEEQPAPAAEEAADDQETGPVVSQQRADPEMAALPQPSLGDRQQGQAFDFYRRMVAWE
ncbi:MULTISPECIES: hypothetical protein [unclassified Rhizobium]|uniref:hypothetical protein n=1 Tax=unclassified Rhizobium TaxID=2613769 RepID=UPI0037F5D367